MDPSITDQEKVTIRSTIFLSDWLLVWQTKASGGPALGLCQGLLTTQSIKAMAAVTQQLAKCSTPCIHPKPLFSKGRKQTP